MRGDEMVGVSSRVADGRRVEAILRILGRSEVASGWDLTDERDGRAREGGSSIRRGDVRRESDVEGNRRRARGIGAHR